MTTAILALNLAPNPNSWKPVNSAVGTSLAVQPTNYGQLILRSNATVAMTDTLPAANPYFMPNGWSVTIKNTDASAAITVSPPAGSTINGNSTGTINAGASFTFVWDGANYWTY